MSRRRHTSAACRQHPLLPAPPPAARPAAAPAPLPALPELLTCRRMIQRARRGHEGGRGAASARCSRAGPPPRPRRLHIKINKLHGAITEAKEHGARSNGCMDCMPVPHLPPRRAPACLPAHPCHPHRWPHCDLAEDCLKNFKLPPYSLSVELHAVDKQCLVGERSLGWRAKMKSVEERGAGRGGLKHSKEEKKWEARGEGDRCKGSNRCMAGRVRSQSLEKNSEFVGGGCPACSRRCSVNVAGCAHAGW